MKIDEDNDNLSQVNRGLRNGYVRDIRPVLKEDPEYQNGGPNFVPKKQIQRKPVIPNRKGHNTGPKIETTLYMEGDERKFGFSIAGGAYRNLYPKIDNVSEESPGMRAGLEVGDEIVGVNGSSLVRATHEEIIRLIHKSSHVRQVTLTVVKDMPLNRSAEPKAVSRIESIHLKAEKCESVTESSESEASESESEDDESEYDDDDDEDGDGDDDKNDASNNEAIKNKNKFNGVHLDATEETESYLESEHVYKKAEVANGDVSSEVSKKSEATLKHADDSEDYSESSTASAVKDIHLPRDEPDTGYIVNKRETSLYNSQSKTNGFLHKNEQFYPDTIEPERIRNMEKAPDVKLSRVEISVEPPSEREDDPSQRSEANEVEEEPFFVEARQKPQSGTSEFAMPQENMNDEDVDLDLDKLEKSLTDLEDYDEAQLIQLTLSTDSTLLTSIHQFQTDPSEAPKVPPASQPRYLNRPSPMVLVNGTYSDRSGATSPLEFDAHVEIDSNYTPSVQNGNSFIKKQNHAEPRIKVVTVNKPTVNHYMGITVKTSDDGQDILIARVLKGGDLAAKRSVKAGDKLMAINGMSTDGLTADEVSDIMGALTGDISLVVEVSDNVSRAQSSVSVIPPSPNQEDSQTAAEFQVRAQFNFDPDKEPRCPCPELALTFSKRQILHVCGNADDDPFWWQAFRDDGKGSHDTSLAGIIPSRKFIEEKEENRKLASADSVYFPKKKFGLKTLCRSTGANKKGKRGKTSKSGNSTDRALDRSKILSYEDVFLASPDHWSPEMRPIVLVSALSGDASALQRRLNEYFPEITVVPKFHSTRPYMNARRAFLDQPSGGLSPQHTPIRSSPVESEHIHVTSSEFQEMDKASKFISVHRIGDFNFGLAIQTVIEAVETGKMCIFTCPDESIQKIRTARIRPYLVFLSAPSRENLKENFTNKGYFLKEDEIHNIHSHSLRITEKSVHLMDDVIQLSSQNSAFSHLIETVHKLRTQPMYCPTSWVPNF